MQDELWLWFLSFWAERKKKNRQRHSPATQNESYPIVQCALLKYNAVDLFLATFVAAVDISPDNSGSSIQSAIFSNHS